MKFKSLVLSAVILFLYSCASIMYPYGVIEDYDEFEKRGQIRQSNNYLFNFPSESTYSFSMNFYIIVLNSLYEKNLTINCI